MKLKSSTLAGIFMVLFTASGGVCMAQAFTGDPTIDNWLWGDQLAYSSTPPVSLTPANYPSLTPEACNSNIAPSWEDNCPSDLTYAPIASTGGHSAFGASFTQIPEGDYWDYVPVYFTEWDWECNCLIEYWTLEWMHIYVPEQSYGQAISSFRWGLQTKFTILGSRYLPTLSLKGFAYFPAPDPINGYFPALDCEPSTIYGFGLSKPCAPWKEDAFVVPRGQASGAGYEGKIIIPNPACPLTYIRTGQLSDANQGCFIFNWQNWYSNLPSAYQDTTKFDTVNSNFENPYVAGVGTAKPLQLVEGKAYYWYIEYKAGKSQTLLGRSAKHTANITMYDSQYPCIPGSGPLCQFNVDQTKINPDAIFIPNLYVPP